MRRVKRENAETPCSGHVSCVPDRYMRFILAGALALASGCGDDLQIATPDSSIGVEVDAAAPLGDCYAVCPSDALIERDGYEQCASGDRCAVAPLCAEICDPGYPLKCSSESICRCSLPVAVVTCIR